MIKNKSAKPKKQKGVRWQIFNGGKEKTALIENLALLLSSGLNVSAALLAVQEEIKSKNLKKIISEVNTDVENGFTLWRALEKTTFFPDSIIALIRIGEESGRLSDNLKIVSEQTEKNYKFRSQLRSAMMYPVFVLALTLIIAIGIAWFILPRLAAVFSQLDINLPLITQIMINFGSFLGTYGYLVVPIFILILFLIIYFLFFHQKTKFIGQNIILLSPGVKKLIRELELARLGYLLGTLLEAGLPIETALDSIKTSGAFIRYQKFYVFLKDNIEAGNSFQKSFSKYRHINSLIPHSVQQMIIAGEQSGNLANILIKIGRSYTEKTEMTTKNLVIILEPLLLIIVWLGVVTVALSIILPIYSLIGGLNKY